MFSKFLLKDWQIGNPHRINKVLIIASLIDLCVLLSNLQFSCQYNTPACYCQANTVAYRVKQIFSAISELGQGYDVVTNGPQISVAYKFFS